MSGNLKPQSERPEVVIRKNAFGRWIIVRDDDPTFAWTGAGWAPVNEMGLPAGIVQVSNQETRKDAEDYAEGFAFVLKEGRHGYDHYRSAR